MASGKGAPLSIFGRSGDSIRAAAHAAWPPNNAVPSPRHLARCGTRTQSAAKVCQGKDEESLALMRETRINRSNDLLRTAKACCFKVGADSIEIPHGEVSIDVFEEDPRCPAFTNNAKDIWPKVSGVIVPPPVERVGRTEGLAGISGNDSIHFAAPRASVEGSQVGPDRSFEKRPVRHSRRQNCGCRDFCLHITDRASRSAASALNSEVESANSGGETEVGMCNHTPPPNP